MKQCLLNPYSSRDSSLLLKGYKFFQGYGKSWLIIRVRVLLFIITSLLWGCYIYAHEGQDIYILIHGTWAQGETWYMKGGDFFVALHQTIDETAAVFPFRWNGKLSHDARIQAAQQLVTWLESFDSSCRFHIIGHSYGAAIGVIASSLLGRKTSPRFIATLVCLGMPVDARYIPDMEVISKIFNFYSYGDMVQSLGGMCGNTLPQHERIVNIRLIINGVNPSHGQMHKPIIAKYLNKIMQDIHSSMNSFEYNKWIVHLADAGEPHYALDTEPHLIFNLPLKQVMFTYEFLWDHLIE